MRDRHKQEPAERIEEQYLTVLRERVAWQAEAAARARQGRLSTALPPEAHGAAASRPVVSEPVLNALPDDAQRREDERP